MEQLRNFLLVLRGDIYKLLPMKESELNGEDNHLEEHLDAMIINLAGAVQTYPELAKQKQYLYALNNLNYILYNDVDFKTWRKAVLNSTRYIDDLYVFYGGVKHEK